jgi:FixJ family two-component response regulator
MSFKIYYLDDENDLLDAFSYFFASQGIEICTFTNPQQLIEKSKATPPDLFFLDYRLPSCTGPQVAAQLDQKIPKILVTGDTDVGSHELFSSVVHKPYMPQQIKGIIKAHSPIPLA